MHHIIQLIFVELQFTLGDGQNERTTIELTRESDRFKQKSTLHLQRDVHNNFFLPHSHRKHPDEHVPQVYNRTSSGKFGNEVHITSNRWDCSVG